MSNSPITDVIFDFCGVLLDWQTRACLTGHFPQDTVDAICAPDDPHGFFRYEDRMDAGEDFSHIYPDVVREQGEDIAPIFAYYIEHYGDALPRMLPGMEDLLRDLKRHGYGVWGLTNWSHETIHIAFEKFPQIGELLQDTVVSGIEKMHKPNATSTSSHCNDSALKPGIACSSTTRRRTSSGPTRSVSTVFCSTMLSRPANRSLRSV